MATQAYILASGPTGDPREALFNMAMAGVGVMGTAFAATPPKKILGKIVHDPPQFKTHQEQVEQGTQQLKCALTNVNPRSTARGVAAAEGRPRVCGQTHGPGPKNKTRLPMPLKPSSSPLSASGPNPSR
ncbi:hypothetical protein QYE76_045782 [Lolium multiflorum]|uniref:Uncharacterized protein n=1 Tax=Lolium multiflorum TaxID=4521 RepID=A0AAD8WYJ0_LOLMU|nr:hypothetical protein QYE76_045782 [Lolium multiflorum]